MAPGGGFGALDTMNKTLKNNAKLLRKTRVFEKIKGYSSALKGKKFKNDKVATPEQLEEFREKALAENRRQTARQIIKIVASIIIFGILAGLLITGILIK